jgi:outer membrane receptor protein involved in Fe transport
MKLIQSFTLTLLAMTNLNTVYAEGMSETNDSKIELDAVTVVGESETFSNNSVTPEMIARRPANASVNTVVQELPGVYIQEADAFGSSDWMTNIRMRGFNSNNGQIGTTIDGMSNGGSDYGGGSKANKYIDVLDLDTVQVSQGTADIGSRSNEALGGTLNFVTSDPLDYENLNLLYMTGDQDAKKYRFRYDSGELLKDTYAFISGSTAENKDVWDNAAITEKDYLTGKIKTKINGYNITGFATYNDSDENEYEYVSLDQYRANPTHDALHVNWTGIPGYDQNNRNGWRALRENTFTNVKIDKDFGQFDFKASAYYHKMNGRGDWMPPYITDVDGDGNLANEFGPTLYGDYKGKDIFYVNAGTKTPATLDKNCKPREGLDAEQDPNCYVGNVTPVSSYRTSNYANRRHGINLDTGYDFNLGSVKNNLRAGLWYEDYDADVTRSWHRIKNSAINYEFERSPYWVQWQTQTNTKTLMYFAQENAEIGPFKASFGLKQYQVDTKVDHHYDSERSAKLDSTSDPLIYTGLTYNTPVDGLELFAGYSENYKAINADVIDSGLSNTLLKGVEPETSENIEVGFRYATGLMSFAATYYDVDFSNRITKVVTSALSGIDYKEQIDGSYVNVGGQKTKGLELLGSYLLPHNLTLSGSYTYNNSKYLTTGDTGLDNDADIVAGNRVYGEPEQMFSLGLDYSGDVLNGGFAVRHVGERYINFKNTAKAPSYEVVDAYLGATLTGISADIKNIDLRLNVNNLLDEEYVLGVGGNDSVYPGSPRTVVFTVSTDLL